MAFINLGDETRLPATDLAPSGNRLAAGVPGAEHHVVAPASHFTFLAPCQPAVVEILAEEGEDPICSDPPRTDRRAVHAELLSIMVTALGLDWRLGFSQQHPSGCSFVTKPSVRFAGRQDALCLRLDRPMIGRASPFPWIAFAL